MLGGYNFLSNKMTKQMLGKHVNLFLIVVVLIVVVILGGFTIFFDQSFNDLGSIEDQLDSCVDERDRYLNDYQDLSSAFASTEEDVEKYDDLYADRVEELGSTQTELNSTLNDLYTAQQAVLDMESQVEDLEYEKLQMEKDLVKLRVEVTELENDQSFLRDKNRCLERLLTPEEQASCN